MLPNENRKLLWKLKLEGRSETILGTCSAYFQADFKKFRKWKWNYNSRIASIIIVKYVLSVKFQEDMNNIFLMSVDEFTLGINLSLACIIQTLEA